MRFLETRSRTLGELYDADQPFPVDRLDVCVKYENQFRAGNLDIEGIKRFARANLLAGIHTRIRGIKTVAHSE